MRRLLIALALSAALVAPVAPAALAAPAAPTGHSATSLVDLAAKHKCTKTASGTCIRGGQFCPNAKKGKKGWDAVGRVYICKAKHWRKF